MLHPLLDDFHFVHPLWLLALVPLAALLWITVRRGGSAANAWQRVIDPRLLPLLMNDQQPDGGSRGSRRLALALVAVAWLLATLALADPAWERRPQPVFQSSAARVIVLDLANSMNRTDLKPDRMTQARFKVEDALALGGEGLTGLVAYAGDAFTVSPLTRDTRTISTLLKVLEPGLMPVQGSRAGLGLLKAGELLRQAGVAKGQVLLIADGLPEAERAATQDAAERLRREGHVVDVLGLGTQDAAALGEVAQSGGGLYRPSGADTEALRTLLRNDRAAQLDAAAGPGKPGQAEAWQERGPWLVLLLLPIALLGFRRHWLFSVALFAVCLAAPPQPAMAASWQDLWQRPDQQAAQALARGDNKHAAQVASDPGLRGSAEYRNGNYPQALVDFARAAGPDAAYNRGNALARLQRYPEAIAAYDQALKARPGDDDAKANKAEVEAMLKKQQQQQQGKPQQQQQQQQQPPGQPDRKPQPSDADKTDQAGKPADNDPAGQPKPGDTRPEFHQQQQQQQAQQPQPPSPADANARRLDGEERLAAEQWLRAIPDDPGGLLRRKFLYQYRQRALERGQGQQP